MGVVGDIYNAEERERVVRLGSWVRDVVRYRGFSRRGV